MSYERAMAARGFGPELLPKVEAAWRALATLILKPEQMAFTELRALYHQKGKFAEGSAPFRSTPRGDVMDRVVGSLLALDADEERSKFVVFLEGAVLAAGGYYPIVPDFTDWLKSGIAQVHKGDPFSKGTIGAIGGNSDAEDLGDPLTTVLRETKQELMLQLDHARLINDGLYEGWRLKDGRIEAFSLWCGAFVEIMERAKAEVMGKEAFTRKFEREGVPVEVIALEVLTPELLFEHIRSERINFPENWQAITSMVATLRYLGQALDILGLDPQDFMADPLAAWNLAKGLSRKHYLAIVSAGPGWHKFLDVDLFK